ncbi:MAG: putative membrane protein [Sphingobacteriales bacterium]
MTGIYEQLLDSLGALPAALPLIFRGQFKNFAQKINFFFLLQLGLGMVLGIGFGVAVVTNLMETQPLLLWAFFFGLIFSSVIYLGKQISWNLTSTVTGLVGLGIGAWFSFAGTGAGSDSLIFIFFSGVLAISALILPGVSGSFLLLLLGMYHRIIPAVKGLMSNPSAEGFTILITFGAGCLIGLFSFAKVVSFTFKKWKFPTMSAMVGLMLGSLAKIWPWQEVIATRVNSLGELKASLTAPVLPSTFESLESNLNYGNDPKIIAVIITMLVGFGVVQCFDLWEKRKSKLA